MILIELRDYLQLVGRVTLQDAARHFKMQEGTMEHLLLFWIKKGRVCQYEVSSDCEAKGCNLCPARRKPPVHIYVWQ